MVRQQQQYSNSNLLGDEIMFYVTHNNNCKRTFIDGKLIHTQSLNSKNLNHNPIMRVQKLLRTYYQVYLFVSYWISNTVSFKSPKSSCTLELLKQMARHTA